MENWQKCDQEIKEYEKQEIENKRFEKSLISNGIKNIDYVDSYGCQINDIWFEAATYLGDLTEMSNNEIAKQLSKCIKATLKEIEEENND
jgi:hypothetical protein